VPSEVRPKCYLGVLHNANAVTTFCLSFFAHDKRGSVPTRSMGSPFAQISITTQCDVRRFKKRLPAMVEVWRGPIVVVVFLDRMDQVATILPAVQGNELMQRYHQTETLVQ